MRKRLNRLFRGKRSAEFDRHLAEVEKVAREVFGFDALRPGQSEAITSLIEGRDVLLVMPTGGGKSAVYQVPGLILHGATVVISPLIALQRDQVESLRERGRRTMAYAVNSAISTAEREAAWAAIEKGEAEFLFLSPEQLANPEVLEKVRLLRPSVIAVDEAHAVSAWGHDFRPDYLRLGEFIEAIGHPRVVALTATAAPPVRDDIVERLQMREAEVIVRGFARPNIALEVVRTMSDGDKRDAVLQRAVDSPKPAIVYTATRGDTIAYRDALADKGLRAEAYHGGLRAAEREAAQSAFMDGEVDVLVATSAFGMGIDKPDIRTVIHATVPDSLDSYYQEVGRAGRDGAASLGVLYFRPEDLGLRRFFASAVPSPDDVVTVARALDGATVPPSSAARKKLAEATGMGPRKVGRILNLLGDLEPEELRDPESAAAQAIEMAEARRTLEESRIEMMRGYCEVRGCRRQFILSYFGEHLAEPCGNCDCCHAGLGEEEESLDGLPFALHARVAHPEFGEGIVMSYDSDPDRVTVLFDDAGYRTLALDAVRDNGLLTLA